MKRLFTYALLSLAFESTSHANSLDRRPFIKAFDAHKSGFSNCYWEVLKRRPLLEGHVTFKFTIDPTKPLGVEILQSLGDDAMDKCLISEAQKIEFPKSDLPIILNYPLTFKPSE